MSGFFGDFSSFFRAEVFRSGVAAFRASAQARSYLLRVSALNRFGIVLGDDLVEDAASEL